VKDKNWRLDVGDNLKQMVEVKPAGATPADGTSPAATVPTTSANPPGTSATSKKPPS